jgi:hypothetical protein
MIGRFGLVIFSIHMPIGTRAMYFKEESNFAFSQKRSLEIRIFFDDYLEKTDIYVCEKKLVESQTFTL